MPCRAIRGAITADKNTTAAIAQATKELLRALVNENHIHPKNIASALFTVSKDLNAAFPATTARMLGWNDVPMLCTMEIPVPQKLKKMYPRHAAGKHLEITEKNSPSIFERRRTIAPGYCRKEIKELHHDYSYAAQCHRTRD